MIMLSFPLWNATFLKYFDPCVKNVDLYCNYENTHWLYPV